MLTLFAPGFLCVKIYSWLNDKDVNFSELILESLVLSYVIKNFYVFIHGFLWSSYYIDEVIKIIIYLISGIILPFGIDSILKTKFISKLLADYFKITLNNNILKDIINKNEVVMMKIYLKSSDSNYYIGKYVIRENNGSDLYIGLIDYSFIDINNQEILLESTDNILNSLILFKFSDIEKIEILYEENSATWNTLFKDN